MDGSEPSQHAFDYALKSSMKWRAKLTILSVIPNVVLPAYIRARPYIAECDKQLSMLRFQRTSRGYLQVHHESSNDRDDFPDSIAGLCSLIIQPENAPITVTIV